MVKGSRMGKHLRSRDRSDGACAGCASRPQHRRAADQLPQRKARTVDDEFRIGRIKHMKPSLTMVGGRIVFEAK